MNKCDLCNNVLPTNSFSDWRKDMVIEQTGIKKQSVNLCFDCADDLYNSLLNTKRSSVAEISE